VSVPEPTLKCVVWDLDNTIWSGTLLEGDLVELCEGVREALETLDRRGILLSIASKNDRAVALAKLQEFGIDHYFLAPQIHWNPKSQSIRQVAESLNLATNVFAFVDDQEFERGEVQHELPEVMVFHPSQLTDMLNEPRMNPRFLTSEASSRRHLYQGDLKRKEAQEEFQGNNQSFLAELDMVFEISEAEESDLQRAEELTERTNQLNTTGYTFSYDELDEMRRSPDHLLLVARLTDRFGPYGTIGLAVVEKRSHWTIKLLLMSCRVVSRGVGNIMLGYLMQEARKAGCSIRAEFVPNGRNRMMLITYRFAGFREVSNGDEEGGTVLEHDLKQPVAFPEYVRILLPAATP
jgi:FkbH-like protein